MAYTEIQAQALREALVSGVLTVEYDGKRVTYRSVVEIKEALAQVETALAREDGRQSLGESIAKAFGIRRNAR